jgi:hypothetical protein
MRYTDRPRVQEFQVSELVAGDFYSASQRFTGVADTNTKTLLVENNDTENGLFLLEPTVRSSGQVYVNTLKNVTVDTAGDTINLINKRTDQADNPGSYTVSTAGDNETGAISGGETLNEITAGSGSNPSNAQAGISAESGIVALIMPGDNIALETTNQSGSTQDTSITAGVMEVEGSVIP